MSKVDSPLQKALVIDDEPAARRKLITLLRHYPHIDVIGEASDGIEAVEAIKQTQPDLVFLDIQMPGKTGLEVAFDTHQINYQLIFVTAYDQYALKAFETHAIDYLLKPVAQERLNLTLQKLQQLSKRLPIEVLEQVSNIITPAKETPKIAIKHGSMTLVIEVNYIGFIEVISGYSRVHLTQEGQKVHHLDTIITDTSLDMYLTQLSDDNFRRLHRSCVVNLKQIQCYFMEGRRMFVKLKEMDNKLPVSRSMMRFIKDTWSSL